MLRRTLLTALILTLLTGVGAMAQTKTTETRTTETEVDTTAEGKVKKTETVTAIASKEDLTSHDHLVYLDPIKFAALFNIGYQHAITPNFTVGGALHAPTQLTDASGWGIVAEGRFYPAGRTFRSFRIAGSIAYNDITAEEYSWETGDRQEVEVAPLAIGLNVGWHWYPWEDFATEFAIGADLNFSGEERGGIYSDAVPFLSNRKGIVPSARLTIGYAW